MSKLNQFILFIAQLILILVLLSSCVTFKKCVDKYGSMEPVTITGGDSVDFDVAVPHDSLSGTIPCPQVASDPLPITNSEEPATTNQVDTTTQRSGRAQIKYWYDKYQQAIRYQVDCLPDTIKYTEYVEVKVDCPQVAVLDPDKGQPWHRALWNGFQRFAAWLVLIEIILVALYFILIRRRPFKLYVEKDTTQDH